MIAPLGKKVFLRLTAGHFFAILERLKKRIFLYFGVIFMRTLLISQAVVALFLILSILLQNRGSGLGAAFGGDFGGYYTKRGLEKFFLYATIFFAFTFFVLGIVNVYFSISR